MTGTKFTKEETMKKLLLASATALTMIAAPAVAQVTSNSPLGSTNAVQDKRPTMTAEQQAAYDALHPDYKIVFDTWTPDQQVMYFGWDSALRDYYWMLEQDQQKAWWYLTDEQQITLYQLEGANRDAAWTSVLTQVADLEDRPEQASATSQTMPRDNTRMEFTSNAVVQQVATHSGEYPVCESESDDNCINPWAAGERGEGVTRPLDYWPGEPASERQLGG